MYKKSVVLKAIRREMEAGNQYTIALRRAGVRSERTLLLWRKRKIINQYIESLMNRNDSIRIKMVEDAHLKKLVQGKGSASDFEFFLVNRDPNRWKKTNNELIHKGEGGHGDVNVNVHVHPGRVTIFEDIKNADPGDAALVHADQGPESNRVAGALQST